MHKTDNTAVSNENSEVFTYIAIPLEVFQACSDQNAQPRTVTQNVILKTLSDGKMCIIDTNHFLKSQSSSEVVQHDDESIIVEANDIKNNNTGGNQNTKVPGTVLIKSHIKDKNDPKKVRVSYMKCKVAQLLNKSNERSKEKSLLKCPLCSEKFEKMAQYKKHMEEHSNMRKYKCEQCSASYNVYDNYKLHMAMHVKGEPTCPMCNRKFQRLASLKAHLMLHEVDETYTCLECTEEFEKEEDLRKHTEIHQKKVFEGKNDKLPLICSYCNYLFEDASDYKKHITHHMKIRKLVLNGKRRKQSSNKEHTHKCSVCDKSFPKYSLLERHLRIHSGEKPFVCNYCNRGFSQKGTLQLHMSLHTGVKRFKCTLCPAKFNQKGNLRAHVERTHMAPVPGEKIYKCTMCTCIFKKVASLNAHITKVHSSETASSSITSVLENLKHLENQIKPSAQSSNRPKLKSVPKVKKKIDVNQATDVPDLDEVNTEIDYDYTYVKLADSSIDGSIRRYVVKQRKAGDVRWYICSYCGKEFKKPSDLIRHIRVHTQERPFKCKQCGLAFSLKSTLASHLNTHVGKREYKCIICMKMFSSIRTLNVHLAKHNKTVTNQHYKCNMCHLTFSSSTKAKMHACTNKKDEGGQNEIQIVMKQPMVLTANGLLPVAAPKPKIPYGELEQYKLRPHRCSICNAAFTKPLHVKRHMLMHTGEKKFKCELCDKAFYTSYALKQHTNFHNGIKNFACKVCNKRFVTNALLKRHLLMHSSQKPYLCPYCEKHFKTVMLCRKHINIHKRDLKMQIHALNETGEIVNLEESDKASLSHTHEENGDATVILPQESNVLLPESSNENVPVQNESSAVQEVTVNLKDSILDKNSVFLWQKNVDDGVPGILNVLNEQQFYQIPIDNNTMDLIVKNLEHESENVTEQPTIFINTDDLESNIPLYIQNEGVLMNDLNNIVYPINTINSAVTFENETPNFENITQNLIYNPEIGITQTLLPSINEINGVNTNVQNTATNLNDTFISLSQESVIKSSDASNYLNDNVSALTLNFNETTTNGDIEVRDDSAGAAYLHESTEITCTACHKVFTSLQELQLHKCCQLSQAAQMKRNKKKNEQQNEATFTSLECNKVFSNNTFYLRHLNSHRNKQVDNSHKCTYCEKSFKKPSDLVRHVRTHTGEKPFSCDKCDKSFSLKSTLESHYKTHNPAGNKEYNCQVCNSYFSSKASLKVHMLLHTGVKPYQCSLCPAKFRTAAHRKLHENWHAKGDKNKKSQSKNSKVSNLIASVIQDVNPYQEGQEIQLRFEKEQADTSVISDENLVLQNVDFTQTIQIDPVLLQHLQSGNILLQESDLLNTNLITIDSKVQNENYVNVEDVTQVLNVENTPEGLVDMLKMPKQKNFECDICHKSYISKSVLTKHVKIHGCKFKCGSCNKGFQTNDELEKHEKLHSGYRPFSCHLCANSFSEEGSLKTHIKRIHQNTNLDSSVDIDDNFMC